MQHNGIQPEYQVVVRTESFSFRGPCSVAIGTRVSYDTWGYLGNTEGTAGIESLLLGTSWTGDSSGMRPSSTGHVPDFVDDQEGLSAEAA